MEIFRRILVTAATSRSTLPVVSVYSLIMALSYGIMSKGLFPQIVLLAIASYLMVLLNNRYSLIRIYSRMVSSTFMVLSVMCPFLYESMSGGICSILFIGFYYLLFRAYQNHHAPATIMYAFLCLGLISTQFVQIVIILPLAWYIMYTRIFTGNTKTLLASIMGFLLPYWLWIGWSAWTGDFTAIYTNISALTVFSSPFDFPDGLSYLAVLLVIVLIVSIAIIHCLRRASEDKIKTRMLYDAFIWIDVFTILFLLLQPQHHDVLLRIIIISSAPLLAHYFTLSDSKYTQYIFPVTLLICFLVTVYNSWM